MLRSLCGNALRILPVLSKHLVINAPQKNFYSSFQAHTLGLRPTQFAFSMVPGNLKIDTNVQLQTSRSVTKFSLNKGKRKTVKAVIKRFKRLNWGGWIRTHAGRHKKLFKKSNALKCRLRQHIFVNGSQSFLLDKMVTNFWRRPKYWIDDPYTPYHCRDEFFATKGKQFKV